MKTGKLPGKNAEASDDTSPALKQLGLLIAKQPFFKGLKPAHLQSLTALAMEKEFKAGEVIFHEGDPSNRFYIILEGTVTLHFSSGEPAGTHLRTLGPGDDLGWSWLFPPYYFLATAQANEAARTIFFYGTRLRQHCDQDHDFGYEIMKRIAQVAIDHLNPARRALTIVNTKTPPPRHARK